METTINLSIDLDGNIARHNANARTLVASFEKSAAHAAFMMHHASGPRERMKYRTQMDRFKRKAREAALTIIQDPPIRFAKEPDR